MIRYGIIATILVLFAVAMTSTFRGSEIDAPPGSGGTEIPGMDSGDASHRLASLEAELREEREIRIGLERRVASLTQLLEEANDGFSNSRGIENTSSELADQPDVEALADQPGNPPMDNGDRQIESLVDEGFSEYEATEIVQMSEQFEMQWLQAQFEARRQGAPINASQLRFELAEQFRENLGEEKYERYLRAVGQPTSVRISNILESSPAQSVGLQSGDEIISYGGRRVYNIVELNRLTQTSFESGYTRVEVVRDGRTLTVSLPPGPIGITASVRSN